MSMVETEHELDRLSLDYRIGDTEIVALVYPQWVPVPGVNSFWKTYGMHPLSFHFGDDDTLDKVIYKTQNDLNHQIQLDESEATP